MSIKHTGHSYEQAAAEFGISEDRLRQLVQDGVLQTIKHGRALLVDVRDTFTLAEAAAIMGITGSWARKLLREESIKGLKMGPRNWLIELREIRRFNLTPKSTAKGRPRLSARDNPSQR